MTADLSGLDGVLAAALSTHFGRPCVVTRVDHQPYVYSTSFALEELEVELADGTCLDLILKDLSVSALLADARASKPAFLYEPRREIETYRRVLSKAQLGTATCYGAVIDQDKARCWLLLEKVAGRELYQIGEIEIWRDVARWLAGMHRCAALAVDTSRQANTHFLSHDAAFYRVWLDRALRFVGDGGSPDQHHALRVVAEGLDIALERLAEMPATFVHGEFYASNVLVRETPDGRRICPVDWEMAGVGPALLDLAALCTGWDDENRRAIARRYYTACGQGDAWPPAEEEFLSLLQCCELSLAVQWLGWAPRWAAPPEHARDWLSEASQLAEKIMR